MNHITTKYAACLLPYGAVVIGLYVLRSAWAALLIYHLGIVLVMVYQARISRWKRLFLGVHPGGVFSAVVVCLLSGPLVFVLWRFMALEAAMNPGAVLAQYRLSGTSWVCFLVYFVALNPALEELFWRDYLRSSLRKLSVLDSAFAGYHILVLCLFIKWPWVIVGFCVLAIVGCLWRRLSIAHPGLAVPWISHTVADASILIAVCALHA